MNDKDRGKEKRLYELHLDFWAWCDLSHICLISLRIYTLPIIETKLNPLDETLELSADFDPPNPAHEAIFSDNCSCPDVEESSLLCHLRCVTGPLISKAFCNPTLLCRESDIVNGLSGGVHGTLASSVIQGTVFTNLIIVCLHAWWCRILELTDTVKHLRSQNSEKDASLDTMQISLDRMVRSWEWYLGGGR